MRKISLMLMMCLTIGLLAGCNGTSGQNSETGSQDLGEQVDYAGSVKFSETSGRAYTEGTVKTYVDGDTVHFNVPTSAISTGILKARFIAINTPESTGKIEEWGKKASNFTKEKLKSATSVIIESDTANWDADSTGDRYVVWIWYKTADSEDYRNLNIEILQNGLALANKSSSNAYGTTCTDALAQARNHKLNLYSGEPDPDFFYGTAAEVSIKELRLNPEAYSGQDVAFTGVVTNDNDNTVYVEEYDPETDMYYGFTVYYGFNVSGTAKEILSVGNEIRVVGSLQYYETGGTWQVADVDYRDMKPDDPSNLQLIAEGKAASYKLTEPEVFLNSKVEILTEEETKTMDYKAMALGSTISMEGLKVVKVYTTSSGDSKGAMTLTCEKDGCTIDVRTEVLYDENKNVITEDAYKGKTIDVKGIVDYFSGDYQIRVFSAKDITVK